MPSSVAVQRTSLIAALATALAAATLVLGISVPMTALGLVILTAGLTAIIRPEIGLHVLVINAMVGLTHVVEMPRLGPFSPPVLIEALLVAAVLFQAAFAGRRVPLGSRQHLLLGLLAVWILVSILTGVSVGPDNFSEYRNLFLVRLVMFGLVTAIMTTGRHLERLVATLLVANVGLLVTAALVRSGAFGEERITISQNFERTGALVQNPNELAFTLTTMLVLAIITFLRARSFPVRAIVLGLAAADLFFIMATLSRSGFISLCVVLAFLMYKLTSNARAVAVILVLVLAGALMVPGALFERFAKIDQVRDVDRFQIVRVGLAMSLDHPVLGVGLGNYVSVFSTYNVSHMRREAPAHNMYLDLAAQMGFPALLVYLTILAITWRSLWRMEQRLRAGGDTRSFPFLLNLAIQAFFVNLMVFGLSGSVEFDYGAFIMLGAAVTLLAAEPGGAWETVGASGRN